MYAPNIIESEGYLRSSKVTLHANNSHENLYSARGTAKEEVFLNHPEAPIRYAVDALQSSYGTVRRSIWLTKSLDMLTAIIGRHSRRIVERVIYGPTRNILFYDNHQTSR